MGEPIETAGDEKPTLEKGGENAHSQDYPGEPAADQRSRVEIDAGRASGTRSR